MGEEKMRSVLKIFVPAIFLASVMTSGAVAESSGWMTGYKAIKVYRKYQRDGYVPTGISCRDSKLRQLDVGETEYNVTFAKNTKNLTWYWAVGNSYGPISRKAEKEGYKRVSFNQYTRPKSGLIVRCAIWHSS
jgi:hypothetical protein